jgi:hypothetical protein
LKFPFEGANMDYFDAIGFDGYGAHNARNLA